MEVLRQQFGGDFAHSNNHEHVHTHTHTQLLLLPSAGNSTKVGNARVYWNYIWDKAHVQGKTFDKWKNNLDKYLKIIILGQVKSNTTDD